MNQIVKVLNIKILHHKVTQMYNLKILRQMIIYFLDNIYIVYLQ